MTLLGWLVIGFCVAVVVGSLDSLLGLRRLARLSESAPVTGAGPRVSIVVAARNEERAVEAGMRSLLAQQYPALEIVAVDDRSTDTTGAILTRLARGEPRLRVLHVAELPSGWLGKNHALALGARAASGEWLLFTDADVVMRPDTLARAIGHAERAQRDFVTVLPDFILPGALLRSFGVAFVIWFGSLIRPWKARDPKSWFFIGVGAFNLVRASAYARAGGHERIRLRPDDDLKLGKILKRSGARCDALTGHGLVSVAWYHSLRETIDGLMKNAFSAVEYQPVLMVGGAALIVLIGVGPLALALVGEGVVAIAGWVTVVCQLVIHAIVSGETGVPKRAALLYPAAALLIAWILLRAMTLNLWEGGVRWRGTFYPLSELRKNRV